MQIAQDVNSVMQELENHLKDVLLETLVVDPPVQTITRQWVPWDQLTNQKQPLIVLVEPSEDVTHRRGQQSAVKLTVKCLRYMQGSTEADANPTNSEKLNDFIKGLRTALLPYGAGIGQNVNTLNGLVSDCGIQGKIIKDAGTLDGQMSALVPIVVTIP